jgi:hypothetical protein
MVTLPISPETEKLIEQLPESEKKTLSLLIQAFVTRPKRNMSQVMDDMTNYAKKAGFNKDKLDDLLKDDTYDMGI